MSKCMKNMFFGNIRGLRLSTTISRPAFDLKKKQNVRSVFLLLDHLLPLLTTAKAAHGDLECGHCGTSRRRHIIAAAGRPASRRPLRDRVRNGVKKKYFI